MPRHLHVVWQEDEQLRRSLVRMKPTFEEFWPDEADRFVNSWLHDLVTTGANRYFPDDPPVRRLTSDGGLQLQTDHDFWSGAVLSTAGLKVARAYLEVQTYEAAVREAGADDPASWTTRSLASSKEQLAAALPALAAEIKAFGATTDELYRDYQTAIDQEQARRARHREVRNLIAQLPQLFIAV